MLCNSWTFQTNVKSLDSSPPRFGKKLSELCFKSFCMKELKDAILSQNHRRSQGGGAGDPGPLNRNATNNKSLTRKPCLFNFSVF